VSGSQLKSPISRNWLVITLCISLVTHHKMDIQRIDTVGGRPILCNYRQYCFNFTLLKWQDWLE